MIKEYPARQEGGIIVNLFMPLDYLIDRFIRFCNHFHQVGWLNFIPAQPG